MDPFFDSIEPPVDIALCGALSNKHLESCPICFGLLCEKNCFQLGCEHVFHSECIRRWKSTQPTCPVCRNRIEETSFFGDGKLLLREINLLKVAYHVKMQLSSSSTSSSSRYSSTPTQNFTIQELGKELLMWDTSSKSLKLEGIVPVTSKLLRFSPFLPGLSPSSVSFPGGGRLTDLLKSWKKDNELQFITAGTAASIGLILLRAHEMAVSAADGLEIFTGNDIFFSSEALMWLKTFKILPYYLQSGIISGHDQDFIAILPRPCSLEEMKSTCTQRYFLSLDENPSMVT
ncbi:hypothetical protein ADUPG1_010302, partial [Aduncisulcus paluster]